MLRAHKDFVILKAVRINAVPALPQFAGDIPPVTGRVVQVGEGVSANLMDTVVVYFPTAGHPYKDEDGSEYVLLRQSNILVYYDR